MTTQTHTIDSVLANLTFSRAPVSGQHTCETPAGFVVITRIGEMQGPKGGRVVEYEIETTFKSDRTRLHYGYASYAVAKRGAAMLVANHLNENGAHA